MELVGGGSVINGATLSSFFVSSNLNYDSNIMCRSPFIFYDSKGTQAGLSEYVNIVWVPSIINT